MLLFGGRVVWKHDAFGPPAWCGGVEGVGVGVELFVVRVVVGVLANVLASVVSDREGGSERCVPGSGVPVVTIVGWGGSYASCRRVSRFAMLGATRARQDP